MTEGKPTETPETEGRSPEEIRTDIEATREQVGDTVEALAAKTDVKAQAKKSAEEAKQQAREKVAEAKTKVNATTNDVVGKARENPLPTAAVGAALAGFLLGRWSKR
jgi:ElaB/YqjD/DUF883 family membrane-anchored ribosome-binding protein